MMQHEPEQPEQPELDVVNVVTMVELVRAAGHRRVGRYRAIMDAFHSQGGTSFDLSFTQSHELAASLQREHGENWEAVLDLTRTDVEVDLSTALALLEEHMDGEERP